MTRILLAAVLVTAALPAVAQDLADGAYTCMIGSMNLGEIAISGKTYAGPAFDGKYEGWYPFQTAGGTVTWGGPLGGISLAGTVVSSVLTDPGAGQTGFDVTIQNASGNFQTVSCYPSS